MLENPFGKIHTLKDFDEYRQWISDQKNPELDKLLEDYNRTFPYISKPEKTDFDLMSEILDRGFLKADPKHEEFYKDLIIEDGTALRNSIYKVVDPYKTNWFYRWFLNQRKRFWKWYAKKFPEKVRYNRHVALISKATKILRNLENKHAEHKQD